MDFGVGQKPPPHRLPFDIENDDPATAVSKRQRSTSEDYQDQLLQQQPPQTRRMIGMGLGLGCFPGGSSGSGGAAASNKPTTPRLSLSTDFASRVISSPKPMIGHGASVSSSTSSDSSLRSRGIGSTISSVLVADSGDEFRDEAVGDKKISGGFSSPESKSSNSTSKSPDVDLGLGAGGGSRRSSSDVQAYPVEKDRDVDEHELGHRLSYLQMRGYDQALLHIMDEGILEECSEGYSSASEELGNASEQVLESQQYTGGVEILYLPRDQPAVVTPERL